MASVEIEEEGGHAYSTVDKPLEGDRVTDNLNDESEEDHEVADNTIDDNVESDLDSDILASSLTNKDVHNAYVKHKRKKAAAARYLLTLPSIPKGIDQSSISNSITGMLKMISQCSKMGRSGGGPEAKKAFLDSPFSIRTKTKHECRNRAISQHLESEESLLMAHSHVDAELAQWASAVEAGFQERGIDEAEECEKLERMLKQKTSELKRKQTEIAKWKTKYEVANEEAAKEEELTRGVVEECASYGTGISEGVTKSEAKRMKLEEETEAVLRDVEAVRQEKLNHHVKNDEFESSIQDLRDSVSELSDRCLECRVDELPGAELKSKVSSAIGELLRLGIPRQSVNLIVKRILALTDFRVIALPTPDEIDAIERRTYEEPD